MIFKDVREQTVVYVVIIAYYWKLNIDLVEMACSNHVIVYWLLKLEHSVDVLIFE